VAALKGPALRLVEPRIFKRLSRNKINLGSLNGERAKEWRIDEDLALNLGLVFRVLAPMRKLDRIPRWPMVSMRMSREEAGLLARHGHAPKHPRRVLAALRMLLTSA